MEATDRLSGKVSSESRAIERGLREVVNSHDLSMLPPELVFLAIIEQLECETKEGFETLKVLSATRKSLRQRCILFTSLFSRLSVRWSDDTALCQAFISREIRPQVKTFIITETVIRETPEQLAMLVENLIAFKTLRLCGNLSDRLSILFLTRHEQTSTSFNSTPCEALNSEACMPKLEEVEMGNIIGTELYADIIAAVGTGRVTCTSSFSETSEVVQPGPNLNTLPSTIL